ncbi:MAG: tetratricopeptide repeat protein [Actinobacteria bacterium]|nr:tetratricopeptide repeat protein [Actinomycetota bacterium]MSX15075.1 tetratricopeptide repeat protein [Actinomycetota bacterium]MSX36057.1 tetratricopeptide repeat protein [Actinomycetota bacterium]MSX76742.1 tetratricopeptide repeat protein [Actinomycetota bacterium]MSZ71251.1 tetratricopeptide repeat protein [Actinomycetota bacterium]
MLGDSLLTPTYGIYEPTILCAWRTVKVGLRYRQGMAIDVTEETFETEVLARSAAGPVLAYLWTPRSEACVAFAQVLDAIIADTQGKVLLAKINVDDNPGIVQAFRVQAVPAMFALRDGSIMGEFQGPLAEATVRQFVEQMLPTATQEHISALLNRGDEQSLTEVLEIEPGHEVAIVSLATILTARGEAEAALALLARVPETDDVRKAAAAARLSLRPQDDYDQQLGQLLEIVKTDDEARQQFVDILEVMGIEDPRTAGWRKKLTMRLY